MDCAALTRAFETHANRVLSSFKRLEGWPPHHRTMTSKVLSHSSPVPNIASFPSSTSVT